MATLWQRLNEEDVPDEMKIHGTLEEYRRFVKSGVWKDFVHFFENSIEDGRDLLETTFEERSIKRTDEAIRGGNEILHRVAEFPYVQIRELEAELVVSSMNESTEE